MSSTVLKRQVNERLAIFEQDVLLKYQIYNGLFLNLPFVDDTQAGARLPIFSKMAQEWLANGKTAPQIVEDFLSLVPLSAKQHLPLLFRFLQFIERQVVLFDALEDVSFANTHDMSGHGTLDYLLNRLQGDNGVNVQRFTELITHYKTRLVLTAHPTQFYPSTILLIIGKLMSAIKDNNIDEIRKLFLQMGLTRFSNTQKPTPIEEANSIIWYLEHVFYQVLPHIQAKLAPQQANLDVGFWPGGDRDGNPYVTAEVTLTVADNLRNSILRKYYADVQKLRQRLTFDIVEAKLTRISQTIKQDEYANATQLIEDLEQVVSVLIEKYQSAFIDEVQQLILKIRLFQFYFAKMDVRQNSAIHRQVVSELLALAKISDNYLSLSHAEQLNLLLKSFDILNLEPLAKCSELSTELLSTLRAVATIQQNNGIGAIDRYIISNTDSATSVIEVLWLANLVMKQHQVSLAMEIIPLFETIEDLANSERIMATLFANPVYMENLAKFNLQQTIMLGFSDGTKDGGYLMANWAIFQAKKRLSVLANYYGIKVIFFDGRGGPPSRGGGETYSFYRSLAREIDDHEIQLTIQGQTISANFGTTDAAIFNLEHLLSAGLAGRIFTNSHDMLSYEYEKLIDALANRAFMVYTELRNDPLFVAYLEEITPLKYLAEANIGSRPAKRNSGTKLKLEDLRAIPFGGAWMQMKQNILGYYGLGSAIQGLISEDSNSLTKLQTMYNSSSLFKGLMDNAMQSLAHTNFALTSHLHQDAKFGKFWDKLHIEAQLSRDLLLKISGQSSLLAENSLKQQTINFREQIIQPLIIIQQYAMDKLRNLEREHVDYLAYENLVKKSLAASINASRNSI